MSSNTTRIAKNTLMLYFRQMLIMLVSLYTVRMVLETLGVEDYGIYNVVAGVVTMFGFLSISMANATQRYLSFEIGRRDFEQLKKIFSLSITIYVLIAVMVLLLAETAGLWFVNNKLVISPERKNAAIWVYQFAIVSFLFTILTAPYMAAIIAYEDMNIYAYVSIMEAVLKLGIVFILQTILWDKLKLYGILLCIVTIINTAIYRMICRIKYQVCRFRFYWDTELFKDFASYTGWNLVVLLADMFKKQGVSILLNQLFNPVVVAARSIAFSVNGAVSSFFSQFNTALRPSIIKSYAAGEHEKMLFLVFLGTKGNFFLMYLFTLPIVIEMNIVLTLWLKNPPEYAVIFTQLMLIDVLVDSMNFPICTAAGATGKIKIFYLVSSIICVLNFPLSWVMLRLGVPVYSIFIIAICLTSITLIARLTVLRRLISLSIFRFFREVLAPIFLVAVLSAVLPVIISWMVPESFTRLCLVTAISTISLSCCMYFIGFNTTERQKIKTLVLNRVVKKYNKH
jgi:O-antigen/teichoic acid export membrane protein